MPQKHYLVFIHGMGEPQLPNQIYDPSFDELWQRVAQALRQQTQTAGIEINSTKDRIQTPEVEYFPIHTNWHLKLNEKLHSVTEAEEALFRKSYTDPKINEFQGNFLQRKAHEFATFFLGDVTAYVSADVNLIRRTVWDQIWRGYDCPGFEEMLQEEGATYSIIAHSLGSVIAFDYLHHIFQDQDPFVQGKPIKPFLPSQNFDERPEDEKIEAVQREKGVLPDPTSELIRPLLQERFRYFFSLGSPIGLFMLRNGTLWIEGEAFEHIFNPVQGCDRGWYNFYDRMDLVAYPLKQLFDCNTETNGTCILEDVRVRNWGIPLKDSHVGYWKKQAVAQKIAEQLLLLAQKPSTSPAVPALMYG